MFRKSSRRTFLTTASSGAAGIGLCHIVPAHVLGGADQPPPSETLGYAIIGQGGLGSHIAEVCTNPAQKTRRLLAICDCNPTALERAQKRLAPIVKERHNIELDAYLDFRDLLERTDIDVVHIGTPPHWHVLMSIMALQMGIDVMSEKPMMHCIAEGPRVIEAAKQYGRICMVNAGCFGDLSRASTPARKLVRAGVLGTPLVGRRLLPHNSGRCRTLPKQLDAPENKPSSDMWTGPAPYKPWRGGPFRHVWDHDGGMQADIGAHVVPTVIECLGKLGEQPVEIEGESQYPPDPAYVQPFYRSTLRYADGTKLILESAVGQEGQTPITFEVAGPKGRVWVEGKSQVPMCDPPELFAEAAKLPDDPKRITTDQAFLTRDASHAERPTAETQFSAEIAIHLSNIAFRTGRKLVWDPAKQTVVGDDQAAALVNLPVRAPWRMY